MELPPHSPEPSSYLSEGSQWEDHFLAIRLFKPDRVLLIFQKTEIWFHRKVIQQRLFPSTLIQLLETDAHGTSSLKKGKNSLNSGVAENETSAICQKAH